MENNGNYPNEKDLNVIKVGSFELDMIYAKSWPGLIRIFQIVSFLFLLITFVFETTFFPN